MMPLPIFSQKTFVIAAIAVAAIAIGGLLLYKGQVPLARALGSQTPPTTSANIVYLSPDGSATSTPAVDPIQEVHIANNGLTLLRGARVLSLSTNTIEVGMTWGGAEFTWSVQTSFNTKFLNARGEKESATSIHIGDIVTVTGKVVRSGARPLISADIVRKQ